MGDKIDLTKLTRAELIDFISTGKPDQGTLYAIVKQYIADDEICKAVLAAATWVYVLRELTKSQNGEISNSAYKELEKANRPA